PEAPPPPRTRPPAPPPAALRPAAPPPKAAPAPPPAAPPGERAEQSYVIKKAGFEGDTFDRRGIRTLIRTNAPNPRDPVSVDLAAPIGADERADLKSLFALRKNARVSPPAVCPRHLDQVAHYTCATTKRPLCEECAEEKKFGGASVRVCAHCGGTVEEI